MDITTINDRWVSADHIEAASNNCSIVAISAVCGMGVEYTLEHGNYNGATMMVYLRTILPIQVDYTPKNFKFMFSNSPTFTIDNTSTCLHALRLDN